MYLFVAKAEVSPFDVKSCDDMPYMPHKKMINLHECEEKFSLTAKISYEVLCYIVLFKEKA